jgi:CRP-like cAMP-binding protein
MNIFEIMLELKKHPIFKFITPEVLITLAQRVEELNIPAGRSIIRKGEFGDTMFMIVNGKIKIHNGERQLKELSNGDIFGELAALSPEKRMASATAIEETLLLKIDHQTIYDIIRIQPEIGKGLILFLCDLARSMANKGEGT